ncbi:MAG: Lead, cadmium, zinc and mercury transporting ATPase [Cytophagaceae bacterium]|jgi:Ca2+-transporting ATPase|nr:Lead, cadmium, zinc and mercury transporting ATPase [Cytophagaceae bacterium]
MAMNWHSLTTEKALQELSSSFQGLDEQESSNRLKQHGENKLKEKDKKSIWGIIAAQFKELMIIILFVAAIISALVGEVSDAAVILVIVVLNAVVGFIQEYRAEKALEELNKLSSSHAKAIRKGQRLQLEEAQLVPGDIVLLEAGDIVPADIRLLEVHSLKVEEASLTGESHAVDKNTEALQNENAALGDRLNMVFKGTIVSNGRATGLVVETGMKTEMGKIAGMLQQAESQTPLQKRLADFSKKLAVVIFIICAVIYGIGVLRGEEHLQMLLTAISVAVAAIPEALPAVITIALALGAKKLVKKNALIRKLSAVETLGSVTYICTDKTGTLTQNKMTYQHSWLLDKDKKTEGDYSVEQLFHLALLLNQDTHQNDKGERTGDATELALVEHAIQKIEDHDISMFSRVHELPFDSDRKMMTTVHQFNERYLVFAKGATEAIVSLVDQKDKDAILQETEKMAEQGMRVLAYAYKIVQEGEQQKGIPELESNMKFLGIVGLIDPPRAEAMEAIKRCRQAGIVPVMITGDYPKTAHKIARDLGILRDETDQVITGEELQALSPEQLQERIEHIKVYARVSPEQKLNIVTALQTKGHYVAMTGDGVNDAPSLRKANIGVAMGITGTEVSKQAAHMILLDDNFSTIIKAVEEGRRVFDNIRKFIRYIMTGNAGEIWTILLAPLIGLPIPLLPIHILWVNLVTDGLPALALANEPAEANNMNRPPRSTSESIFAHGVGLHILWVGLLIGLLCTGIQYYAIGHDKDHWQTMVFTTLSFTQLFHVFAIRSESTLIFKHGIFGNLPLLFCILFTIAAQLALVYLPFMQQVFKTKPLTLAEVGICFIAPVIVFVAVEVEKIIRYRGKAFGR